jgi:Acetyltransferases, including N-acetylases of ribosomal proteins
MERKIYISNGIISLTEYLPCDDKYSYNDWLDIETQKGYNFRFNESYENFRRQEVKQRFLASIIHNKNNLLIGEIGISPINTIPDLAIRIYKPFRMQGYGTIAFMLGTQYAIENLNIGEIHAGCYQDNIGSLKMLQKCGYIPYPEGNQKEKHFISNEDIMQLDYIFRRNNI